MQPRRFAIIVHGGAGGRGSRREPARRKGCLAAVLAGRDVLQHGGTPVDAAVAAVKTLEDDPNFNAGTGSVKRSDGSIEMDAAVMDGATLDIGAVGALRGIRNPVEIARLLLREPEILLVGAGADAFAREHHTPLAPVSALPPDAPTEKSYDTVGCVAFADGRIATAISTGGMAGRRPGRIGDSPLPGCGYYARDGIGGVTLSGDGEMIARTLLAAEVMRRLQETGAAGGAASLALKHLDTTGGEAGIICIDAAGNFGWAHNSPTFAVAYAASGAEPRVYVTKAEEAADRA